MSIRERTEVFLGITQKLLVVSFSIMELPSCWYSKTYFCIFSVSFFNFSRLHIDSIFLLDILNFRKEIIWNLLTPYFSIGTNFQLYPITFDFERRSCSIDCQFEIFVPLRFYYFQLHSMTFRQGFFQRSVYLLVG